MPVVRKINARNPEGKLKWTSISMTKYTPAQADEIEKGWKSAIRSGRPYERPLYPEEPPKDSGVHSYADLFQHKPITSLEFPNNGGVSFACIGSTRSGKSTAMCYIYEKWFKKHITILMTLSSHAEIYKPLKKAVISTGFHKELIEETMKLNRETKNKHEFCLIFDDLSADGKNADSMTKLLTIGRNSNMSVILCGQRLQMLNSTGRANVNYVCLFRQNTESAIEDTIKTYLRSYFPRAMSINECIEAYKELTADHQFFCIDTLNDKVFLSKIPPPPPKKKVEETQA